jgi:hypothetical protein
MWAATGFVWFLSAYTLAGLVFAAAFLTIGVARLDPAARTAGWAFRLMILPGCLALWPLLLNRWVRSQ